ncbi:outer membrane protein assembly factor BamB family protein [Halococcoides cellulosivorans]|uniref:Pyrrolo-quinoline quinone repeat domain-containing protein n=1 Tax=Halococcoides cellulosivorans TaxID=1679096 RepID=A0A2R4X0X2_9EURY|nr:PQQ-binding-like beta-propeller repeat protein [Halococcoides cellulosivorans]AWB27447.1 hypothetical protein HARCEL1_06875 [Halococcoides cellulosivorans]
MRSGGLTSRRRFLSVLGAGTLSIVGATGQTASAETERSNWAYDTGEGFWDSSPTVVNGTVFAAGTETLYAIDANAGTERWVHEFDHLGTSSPAVVDGTVFVGDQNGVVTALDAETGAERWAFETDDVVDSSPTVVDGTVFVGSWDDSVYAIDAETGIERWSVETHEGVVSSPVVTGGVLYVGSMDGRLYALDAATGTEQWRFETDGPINASPTVASGTVFVPSFDRHLYALDAKTGTEQWSVELHPPIDWDFGGYTGRLRSSPTVANGTVYVGSFGKALHALDAETGALEWHFESEHVFQSSPTVVSDTVFVGSNSGGVVALDTADGSTRWADENAPSVSASPTVADGTVFVVDYDGVIHALDADVIGSGEGSRARLGTLGHHGSWQYADQEIDIPGGLLMTARRSLQDPGIPELLVGGGIVGSAGFLAHKKWNRSRPGENG